MKPNNNSSHKLYIRVISIVLVALMLASAAYLTIAFLASFLG